MLKLAMMLEETDLKDTIEIKQEGVKAFLEAVAPYYAANGNEIEDIKIKLSTNLPHTEIDYKVEYLMGSEGWLESLVVADYSPNVSFLNMTTTVNPSDEVRKAKIHVSHLDGWDQLHSCECYITQAMKKGKPNAGFPNSFTRLLRLPA